MRVFVTGVKGQLGYDVMNELEKQGLEGIGVDIDEMDITDADQVNKVIKEAAPDAVIPAPAPAPNICAAGRFPAASGPKELLPSCGSRRSGSPCRNAPAPAVLRSGRHASCRQVHLIYRTR